MAPAIFWVCGFFFLVVVGRWLLVDDDDPVSADMDHVDDVASDSNDAPGASILILDGSSLMVYGEDAFANDTIHRKMKSTPQNLWWKLWFRAEMDFCCCRHVWHVSVVDTY